MNMTTQIGTIHQKEKDTASTDLLKVLYSMSKDYFLAVKNFSERGKTRFVNCGDDG